MQALTAQIYDMKSGRSKRTNFDPRTTEISVSLPGLASRLKKLLPC